MQHGSVWRAWSLMTLLLAVTSCAGDSGSVVGPPIDGFAPGIILEARGDLEETLVFSDELAVFLKTPRAAANAGWAIEGLQQDQDGSMDWLVSVGRGTAGVGDWEFIQPEPGEEWENEERDVLANLQVGTAWLVLNRSGEEGALSLLSVSGTLEVVKTSADWAAGYISVSLIEQDFETGSIPEDPRQATLQGTFNIRYSTMGEI